MTDNGQIEVLEDISKAEDDKQVFSSHPTGKEILGFAKQCLAVCAAIFILSSIFYGYSEGSKVVFEKVCLVIPPIVTLILVFYFSKNK